MGENITLEMILHISHLAHLQPSAEEIRQARKDMQQMLEFAEILNRLDTENVEPVTHPFAYGNVFRNDETISCSCRQEILSCAPCGAEGEYRVPLTLEQGGMEHV